MCPLVDAGATDQKRPAAFRKRKAATSSGRGFSFKNQTSLLPDVQVQRGKRVLAETVVFGGVRGDALALRFLRWFFCGHPVVCRCRRARGSCGSAFARMFGALIA